MENRDLWDLASPTDRNFTKRFTRGGGFAGTAINATYMIQRATEVFGPVGLGWGWEIMDEKYQEGAPGDIIHVLRVRIWFTFGEKTGSFEHFGQTTFVGKNKNGPFTDEEAPKKSLTDAITKALSCLGFASEIHMGRWDDVKGVKDRQPAGVMKIKESMRELAKELRAAQTLDDFEVLVTGAKNDLEACERELPEWYHGDGGDSKGIAALIAACRSDLKKKGRAGGNAPVRKSSSDIVQ